MSKFTALTKGLEHLSPHSKDMMKEAGEKLNALRGSTNPNDIHEMRRLSDMLRGSVEANAKRAPETAAAPIKVVDPVVERDAALLNKYADMTKGKKNAAGVAAVPAMGMQNPLDMLKSGYDKFEGMRGQASDYLADQVTGYLPEVSKEKSIDQAKSVMNTATDPLSYIGGVGGVDAAIGAASALPEDSFSKLRKALLGN